MTTNEAAKKAAELYVHENMSGKQIAKKLAKLGYLSCKSGNPLTAAGALALAKKFTSGKPIMDRISRKHAKRIAKRAQWRVNRQAHRDRLKAKKEVAQQLTIGLSTPSFMNFPLPPAPLELDTSNQEQQARAVMKRAIETMVLKMFGAKVIVLLPLDVTFRVEG